MKTGPRDEFERYYTEKISELDPRDLQGRGRAGGKPDVLRSHRADPRPQAAIARRSIDRLWDDQFIELCDALGRRLYRRPGRTRRCMNSTAAAAAWTGAHDLLSAAQGHAAGPRDPHPGYRRLGRHGRRELSATGPHRHGLDPNRPSWKDLSPRRRPEAGRSSSPFVVLNWLTVRFDEFFHTPDLRQLRGKLGRYNIPKLNVHLLRLLPFEVNFATAADFGEGRFTFDPSGRDIPLFRPDQRPGRRSAGQRESGSCPPDPLPAARGGATGSRRS